MSLLIFPSGMPAAIALASEIRGAGKRVIGASSIAHDPSREHYPEWHMLPFVGDENFSNELSRLISTCEVSEIFTANPAVWNFLNSRLFEIAPSVRLLGDSPVAQALSLDRQSRRVADGLWKHRDFLGETVGFWLRMSRQRFDALVRHAEGIPGMCDHQKLLTLAEVFRNIPEGDVVEIGSWWGKSAFILCFLAQTYTRSNVLCVDPWSNPHITQAVPLLDDHVEEMSADEAHQVFLSNLIPYASGRLNYLRLPSVDGAIVYRNSQIVESSQFGSVNYTGRISFLHIDGNHMEDAVRADVDAWCGLVAPGGWICFDDYRWLYGNGPKVVADEFVSLQLSFEQPGVDQAFFSGGALFVRRSA